MDTKQVAAPTKLSKKEARKLVYSKLSSVLTEYKTERTEKKFNSKLKKASKLFVVDIIKSSSPKIEKRKKENNEKNEKMLLKAANE